MKIYIFFCQIVKNFIKWIITGFSQKVRKHKLIGDFGGAINCVFVFMKGKNEKQFGKNYKEVPFDRSILLWGYTNTEIIRQVHIATKSTYTTKTLNYQYLSIPHKHCRYCRLVHPLQLLFQDFFFKCHRGCEA